MDTVFLHGFQPLASVGLLDAEKAQQQRINIDLDIKISPDVISTGDAVLDNTVDYARCRELILDLLAAQHYELLETLAEVVASAVFQHFPAAHTISLAISKPDIFADVAAAGIAIQRCR